MCGGKQHNIMLFSIDESINLMTYVNHVHQLLEFVHPSGGLVGQRVMKTNYKTAFHPFSHLGT